MSLTIDDKDLGVVTAYAYAVSKGYTGTEDEFAELMASYASVAEQAAQSAEAADESAEDSESFAVGKRDGVDVMSDDPAYHNNAKYYAEQAAQGAGTASQSANNAAQSAQNAAESATAASQSASGAENSATAASESASTASTAATTAQGHATNAASSATAASGSATSASNSATAAANSATAATTAQTAAETAQGAAETAAQSVSQSAAQISQNTADVADLKSAVNKLGASINIDLQNAERHFYIPSSGKLTNSANWNSVVLTDLNGIHFISGAFGTTSNAYLGIAFYSDSVPSEASYITGSGAAIVANGEVITATKPGNALSCAITTRLASYPDSWATAYSDTILGIQQDTDNLKTDMQNAETELRDLDNDFGNSNLVINIDYDNAQFPSFSLANGYITQAGNWNASQSWKTVIIKNFKGLSQIKGKFGSATPTHLGISFFNSETISNSTLISGVQIGESGSEIAADVPNNAVIAVVATRPGSYPDYYAKCYINYAGFVIDNSPKEKTIIDYNADRIQLFSNFLWSINTGGGTAIDNQDKILSLLHFSDIHSNKENLQNVMDYYNAGLVRIDDILFTGDYVLHDYTDGMSFWTDVLGTERILGVIGNHDATDTNDHYANNVPQSDLITTFFYGINSWDCVHPEGKTWWYKDYTQGFRLIGLNSSLGTALEEEDQLVWLKNVLSDAITNELNVIVAIHFPLSGDKINSNFTDLDHNIGTVHIISSSIVDAIDNFIDNTGKFVCYLCGHTHGDFLIKNVGTNTQVAVCVTTAKNENGYYGDQARKRNTRSNDAFNLVSFDPIGETIKVIRIGANVDHYLRPRNTVTINYITGEIIAET